MKRVYISIPISGYDIKEVKRRAYQVKALVRLRCAEGDILNVITPFDVCPDSDKPYSYFMGKDIEALLECDAIFLCEGWQNSKGCMAEFEVAKIYNKKIIIE